MSKKPLFKQPNNTAPAVTRSLDDFVKNGSAEATLVKTTLRLEEDLHERLKISLARKRGDTLQKRMVRLLEADLAAEESGLHSRVA